ncbi:MAG: type II toxin-antitoxin system ParD family antitoxin [Spartobacteria bacterium]
MKIKLTPQLEQFIERQIAAGRFENASDAICDGIRLLQQRDQVTSSLGFPGAIGDSDIEAPAFLVLMEAAKSAREDLQAIMEEMKAINQAKAALRGLLSKVNHDIAANTGEKVGNVSLKFGRCGLGSEKAYHRLRIPYPDSASSGGVRWVPENLYEKQIKEVGELRMIQDKLKGDLDSQSEMGEMASLRLQMAMERRSRMMSTISNLLKKISDSSGSIIGNLK